MTTQLSALQRAAELLATRLERLEARLSGDDDAVWREYRETVTALASVLAQMTPGRNGGLLTTAQMAERLHVTPKTLLKRKAKGQIIPAVHVGKLIRWRGDERPRGNPSTLD